MKNVTLKALGIADIINERSELHIRVSARCRTLEVKARTPLPSGTLPSEKILVEITLLRESNSQILSKLTQVDRQSKSFLTREAHVVRDLTILKGLDEELERLEDVWFQLSLRIQVEEITKATELRDLAMKQELDKLRHHQNDISTLRRIIVVQALF